MNKINCRIVADSKNEFGQRITTFIATFPRIVLSELNTHRMFSRNSASSRAIPFKKMAEMVEKEPFIPLKWQKDHSGMQGTQYFDEDDSKICEEKWLRARDEAVIAARSLNSFGATKQLCNRLLEPFLYHTALITSTEWENFFALRAHPDAEIHIQELAHRMLEQYNVHAPKQLKAGEWHIPFGDNIIFDDVMPFDHEENYLNNQKRIKIATARCARVSYLNFEGKDDYEADIKLHDQLLAAGHMSCFEHCAKAMNEWEMECNFRAEVEYYSNGNNQGVKSMSDGWLGNFRGWVQYRKMIQGENKSDNRVNK